MLKEENSRMNDDLENAQSLLDRAEMIQQKCKDGLRYELERAESLEREKAKLQNDLETLQVN